MVDTTNLPPVDVPVYCFQHSSLWDALHVPQYACGASIGAQCAGAGTSRREGAGLLGDHCGVRHPEGLLRRAQHRVHFRERGGSRKVRKFLVTVSDPAEQRHPSWAGTAKSPELESTPVHSSWVSGRGSLESSRGMPPSSNVLMRLCFADHRRSIAVSKCGRTGPMRTRTSSSPLAPPGWRDWSCTAPPHGHTCDAESVKLYSVSADCS